MMHATCFHKLRLTNFIIYNTPKDISADEFMYNRPIYPHWWEVRGENFALYFKPGNTIELIGYDRKRGMCIARIISEKRIYVPDFCYIHHGFDRSHEVRYISFEPIFYKWFIENEGGIQKQPFSIAPLLDSNNYAVPFSTVQMQRKTTKTILIRVTQLYGIDKDMPLMEGQVIDALTSYCIAAFKDDVKISVESSKFYRLDSDRTTTLMTVRFSIPRKKKDLLA